ncbi:MAG: DoxX family protein, partial [Bacteroidetes bacterium]|nr:DoxX family protein [Bacteroidota bacterium]
MKATRIIYWISTILVIAMMLYSAYGTFFIHNQEGADVMEKIAIPTYLMQFLAVAKVLGAIVILVPGYPRLKDWAYAGYFFDLAGATYCFIYNSSKFPA